MVFAFRRAQSPRSAGSRTAQFRYPVFFEINWEFSVCPVLSSSTL
jgi:hypothetical protein